MPAELKSVYSSWVAEVGYDAEAQQLIVITQKGTRIVHAGVPEDVANQVLSAPSIGEALHALVRGAYPGTKV